ncbi:hydroxymethylglutaryl-CoA lyase [Halalkalibacter kiskunsagensis]|uniref:Hydroxymethylglutaryl-CoA lyase n=1 Tax=Halalkalibacter kiskunsagensis TaxID=1548599 RepID=A0ABV6KK60_9BACI
MNKEIDVRICEVGPRDGLQNEQTPIDTAKKVAWINQLVDTGLTYIELTSFVHPKWIPALSDAREVVRGVKRKQNVTFGALVPNERGLERALEAGVDEIAIFLSASETHNRKNLNQSIDQTYTTLLKVINEAKNAGKSIRGYISMVFGCPFEGQIHINQVSSISYRLMEMGVNEISLGDTIGIATPNQVEDVLRHVSKQVPLTNIALHPHDTSGTALVNTFAAYKVGVRAFDGSVGGLGGCPYAPGAAGNVATEDMVFMFEGMGVKTGVQLEKVIQCAQWIQSIVKRNLPSHRLQMALAHQNKGGVK